MGINMGMHPLLAQGGGGRKFRWLLTIQPFIGIQMSMLPPTKAARPNISFKEYQVEHMHETIYFPGKVEWQTLEVTVYDIKCNENPIYEWLKLIYNPDPGDDYYQPAIAQQAGTSQFKTTAQIDMYDGCGNIKESWIYMNAYPSKIDWGELDMTSSDLITVDISIRYDRAYIIQPVGGGPMFNFLSPKQ